MQKRIKQLGYTLVGMSIALGVAGLMLAAIANGLGVYFYDKAQETNRGNVLEVKEAIEEYVKVNGYYPCPAPLTVSEDDASYGLPGDCTTLTDVDVDDIDDNSNFYIEASGAIIRGAVPFRVLNIPRKSTVDSYDGRIEYAVTTDLTKKDTYSSVGGLIDVVEEDGVTSILPVAGKAHFVVYSHGRDKVGSHIDASGIQTIDCSVTSSTKDIDNCSGSLDGVYRSMPMSDLGMNDADHYDDFLLVSMSPDLPFWSEAINNTDNIYFDTGLAGSLSIGYSENEKPKYYSDVAHSISAISQATHAVLTTSAAHDLESDDSIYLDDITGMTELNGRNFIVEYVDDTNIKLSNMYGKPVDSTAYTVFGGSGNLFKKEPISKVFVKDDVKVSGNIYTHHLCDAEANDLNSDPDGRNCIKIDSLDNSGAGVTCASGYVSSIEVQDDGSIILDCGTVAAADIKCPAGKVMMGISMAGGIECDYPPYLDCADMSVELCPSSGAADVVSTGTYKNGSIVPLGSNIFDSDYQENYKCVNGNWELIGVSGECDSDETSDAYVQNLCVTDTTISEYKDFAIYNNGPKSGYIGLWDVEISNICEDDFVSVASAAAPDNIACFDGEVREVYESCPDGEEGYIVKTEEWDCAGPSWLTLTSDDSNCAAISAPTVTYCATGYSGANCATCNDGIEQFRTRIAACGELTENRTLDCATGWSPWAQVSCAAATGTWEISIDDPIGPIKDKGSEYRLGDACYDNVGVHRACYTPAGAGVLDGRPMYYQYKDCVCQ